MDPLFYKEHRLLSTKLKRAVKTENNEAHLQIELCVFIISGCNYEMTLSCAWFALLDANKIYRTDKGQIKDKNRETD